MAVAALLFSVGVGSCAWEPPPEYRSFFNLPLDEQEDSLRTFPLQEQIDLLVVGSRRPERPLLYLVRPVARRGQSAIPVLLARLEGTRDAVARAQLLLVFQVMACDYYDVASDSATIRRLTAAVMQMKEGSPRVRAEGSLASVQGEDVCY